ncbi:peptidylprolyl isomerase [Solihabitans fulvus]|uniref:Peptidyl-prolyl cis-trans isomerase n=1 Tax=Solihabitans fulvus TaxID=1892852 RepID=A0A5B2XI13_9PSEU|nr:peptidylprolyl isomerase [Solihabitans fulvus]
MRLATNQGEIVLALDQANAPCAVHSLVFLATSKFYDGTPCHRLTTAAQLGVLQCGDPSGVGTGTPGYAFDDELTGKEIYGRGVVAMANSGPGTNGSQFFIVHSHAEIPPSYTVLGTVSSGLDVLDKIVQGGVVPGDQGAGDGKPVLPVTITQATVS